MMYRSLVGGLCGVSSTPRQESCRQVVRCHGTRRRRRHTRAKTRGRGAARATLLCQRTAQHTPQTRARGGGEGVNATHDDGGQIREEGGGVIRSSARERARRCGIVAAASPHGTGGVCQKRPGAEQEERDAKEQRDRASRAGMGRAKAVWGKARTAKKRPAVRHGHSQPCGSVSRRLRARTPPGQSAPEPRCAARLADTHPGGTLEKAQTKRRICVRRARSRGRARARARPLSSQPCRGGGRLVSPPHGQTGTYPHAHTRRERDGVHVHAPQTRSPAVVAVLPADHGGTHPPPQRELW